MTIDDYNSNIKNEYINHGDFHLENIKISSNQDYEYNDPKFSVIDWEYVNLGPKYYDLVYICEINSIKIPENLINSDYALTRALVYSFLLVWYLRFDSDENQFTIWEKKLEELLLNS